MKTTKKVYMNISGFIFRTEIDAKEYYGERFDSAIENNILFKFIVDKNDNVTGEWN